MRLPEVGRSWDTRKAKFEKEHPNFVIIWVEDIQKKLSVLEAANILPDIMSPKTFFHYRNCPVPLSKPAIMVVGVFTFIWTWNDFFKPLLYLEDVNKYTLALSLQQFVKGSMGSAFGIQWNYLMAASIVVCIPIIVLFFLARVILLKG